MNAVGLYQVAASRDDPPGRARARGSAVDAAHVHYGEVGLDGSGQLVTSGLYGWTLVVTGQGASVAEAKAAAYANARGVTAPNLRYRLDIGDRLIHGQLAEVERLGFLASANVQARSQGSRSTC